MGYREDIEALELADDVKERLIRAHESEVDPLRQQNEALAARDRRESVETEVGALRTLFSDDENNTDAVGLLKFYRRCLLSGDAEEPGAVLLSDNEMGLSGDVATGANGREEISVAGALRKFVELMPRNAEGRLAVNLSDQANAHENDGRPKNGGDEQLSDEEAAARRARLAGREIKRSETRSKRYGTASITTGAEV